MFFPTRSTWFYILYCCCCCCVKFDINPNIVLDQKHVWPWARFNAMQHDSYRWDITLVEVMMVALGRDDRGKGCDINHNNWSQIKNSNNPRCGMYPGSIGFPTRRKKELGNYIASNNSTMWFRCPKQCRRQPEWTHCWLRFPNRLACGSGDSV